MLLKEMLDDVKKELNLEKQNIAKEKISVLELLKIIDRKLKDGRQ
ncbi:MAG: hypothetical protein ACTSX6_08155 [Candidatus Heimdallarchaeaceae archaeon]